MPVLHPAFQRISGTGGENCEAAAIRRVGGRRSELKQRYLETITQLFGWLASSCLPIAKGAWMAPACCPIYLNGSPHPKPVNA